MQPRDASQRAYLAPPAGASLAQHASSAQPPIPPVSPALLQSGGAPPRRPGSRSTPPIPNIDELRSATPRGGVTRLNAPNLTTYIEHYRTLTLRRARCIA